MPWPANHVPKYRKHRKSGQAVVTIAGKDHYLGPHGTQASKALYDRLIAEYLSAGRLSAATAQAEDISVTRVLGAYWLFAKGYYRKNGEPTNEIDAMRVIIADIRKLYGELPAVQFGPKALKAVRQVWIDRGQVRSTVNKNQRRLTRIFKWAVAEELIPPAVHQALSTVPGLKKGRCNVPEAPPILPVDVAAVERTIPHMLPVTADMVRLQLLTGMRPGEVCKLRPKDIDRSGDVWEYRVAGHKTEHHGRTRTVYIGPAAQAVLTPYLLRDASAYCFSPAEAVQQMRAERTAKRKTPPSCGNRPGTNRKANPRKQAGDRYTPDSYRRAIHYACRLAFPPPEQLAKRNSETAGQYVARLTASQTKELEKWHADKRWSPNQLRHTTATAIRRQFGLEHAQIILGHAAANVTEIYAERDAEKGREVARLIG